MTLFTITAFIWIHFLIDYFIDPTYIRSYTSLRIKQIIHAIMYMIAFSLFGIYFAVAVGIIKYLFDLFSEYCLLFSKEVIPGKSLPYVLKIIRGVNQMLSITSLFIIYFLFLQFGYLGPRFF